MQVPSELKPVCWGMAGGAAALWIAGFTWGGWTTAGAAASQAKQRADTAVVAALAPICASQFQHHADAGKNFDELREVSSWQQGSFVEKGGWATMPGSSSAEPAVASACATLLLASKFGRSQFEDRPLANAK